MKTRIQKIGKVLLGRAARNIYFILFLLYARLETLKHTPDRYAFLALLALLLAAPYINNFVLIPRLLSKKKHLLYLLSTIACTVLFSFTFTKTQIYLLQHIHGLQYYTISPLPIETKNTPSLYAGYLVLAFFINIIFTLCWYIMDYRKKQEELSEVKKKQTETELAFLKSQLNPHFLFNTLNNLYGLALKKADNTPDAILKLSVILRYLLYESDAPLVAFNKEMEIMQAYIDLELLRLNNKDNFHFYINADNSYQVPPLLWLPILENLFKHGTRQVDKDTQADYRCFILDNAMHISSTNTRKHNEARQRAGGIGLENLKKRLALLYAGKYTMNIDQTDNQYSIDIKISL